MPKFNARYGRRSGPMGSRVPRRIGAMERRDLRGYGLFVNIEEAHRRFFRTHLPRSPRELRREVNRKTYGSHTPPPEYVPAGARSRAAVRARALAAGRVRRDRRQERARRRGRGRGRR